MIFAAAGGALVGWPLGQAIGGHDQPKWALAGIGGAAIAAAIPFTIGATNSMNDAVKAHNERFGGEPNAVGAKRTEQ